MAREKRVLPHHKEAAYWSGNTHAEMIFDCDDVSTPDKQYQIAPQSEITIEIFSYLIFNNTLLLIIYKS